MQREVADRSHRRHRTRGTRTIAAIALLLALAPAWAGAADNEEPKTEFTEDIEVSEVLIDVLVTDKKGHVVLGLDEDDFIVRENGEPMEITSVDFYSNRQYLGSEETADELGLEPGGAVADRYFILFFHHQRRLLPRLGANLLNAGHRARQWVKGLQSNDYVAVASYDFKLNVQDFSNDPAIVTAAIEDAVRGKDFSERETDRSDAVPSLVREMPEGDADRIYEAIAMTAKGAGAVRGRKNLILFSIGFGELEAFGFYRPDQRYYPEMIRTLNDNNVAVYPIDILAIDFSPFLRRNLLDNVLATMALETGGQFYTVFTNYLTPLEQIAEDSSGYYLVAYSSPHDPSAKGYQEVDVETRNANFKTRYREGYAYGDEYPYSEAPDAGP